MWTRIVVFAISITTIVSENPQQCERKTFETDKIVGYCCIHYKHHGNSDDFREILRDLETKEHNTQTFKFDEDRIKNSPHRPTEGVPKSFHNHHKHSHEEHPSSRPTEHNPRPHDNSDNAPLPPGYHSNRPAEEDTRREPQYNHNDRNPKNGYSFTVFVDNDRTQPSDSRRPQSQNSYESRGILSIPPYDQSNKKSGINENLDKNGGESRENISKSSNGNRKHNETSSTHRTTISKTAENSSEDTLMTTPDLNNRNGLMDVPEVQCPQGQGKNSQGECVDPF